MKMMIPVNMSLDMVFQFIQENLNLAEVEMVEYAAKCKAEELRRKAIEKEEHFVSGASTRILGHQLTIMVQNSNRKQVIEEDGVLHVYTTESDQSLIDRQVNNWWQRAANLRIYEFDGHIVVINPTLYARPPIKRL